ncbi:MAG: hypothetical protein J5632_04455 [Bacteroidales bacterium]|nr:hypothetical protein [Bacteroidales bacterium]
MKSLPVILSCILMLGACAPVRKAEAVRRGDFRARIEAVQESSVQKLELGTDNIRRDTLTVRDENGNEVFLMRAARDENGEMVAREELAASMVVAAFKNVAERHGKVDLRFDIIVPAAMTDRRWQIRLEPVLHIMEDSVALEPVLVTGEDFRRAQQRGYARYGRFLGSIDTDSASYLRKREFDIFVDRNAARNEGLGVTRDEAVEHYTRMAALHRGERRDSRKDEMFRRYVKSPIISEGLRLDTVIVADGGELRYSYVQTINTRPKLRKAEIELGGGVFSYDGPVCRLPESGRLTYYISSLSTLADDIVKYRMKVVERVAYANSVCRIEFPAGSAVLDTALGRNAAEMATIGANIKALSDMEEFEVDSVVVVASCSPEGPLQVNKRLSALRGKAVCDWLGAGFIPREVPENWQTLDALVERDTLLTAAQKADYGRLAGVRSPDAREDSLSRRDYYPYLRGEVYPRLRTVSFKFCLHRRGMVKDTIHTTEPDTLYMAGVQALKDRNYSRALDLLRPYRDFNTALAYCALDHDEAALSLLREMPPSAKGEYVKALLHARLGEEEQAVLSFMNACKMDPAFVHRGNLDPEISALLKKYKPVGLYD